MPHSIPFVDVTDILIEPEDDDIDVHVTAVTQESQEFPASHQIDNNNDENNNKQKQQVPSTKEEQSLSSTLTSTSTSTTTSDGWPEVWTNDDYTEETSQNSVPSLDQQHDNRRITAELVVIASSGNKDSNDEEENIHVCTLPDGLKFFGILPPITTTTTTTTATTMKGSSKFHRHPISPLQGMLITSQYAYTKQVDSTSHYDDTQGILVYKDGSQEYEGEFHHGLYNGMGKLTKVIQHNAVEQNIQVYMGQFANGKRHGEGSSIDTRWQQ